MPIARSNLLINEARTSSGVEFVNETTATFIITQYFYYGIKAMANGYLFASEPRFAIKMKRILYSEIPKRFRKMFVYSTRLFGYAFVPICENISIKKYGYNFKPDVGLLKRIAGYVENDYIYKLIKK